MNNDWIKGKPTQPGNYWLVEYIGHGEFGVVQSIIYWDFSQEIKDGPEYPKPNHGDNGYSGEALRALIAYEETHEKELCRIKYGKATPIRMSWIEAYIEIKTPDLPDWLE